MLLELELREDASENWSEMEMRGGGVFVGDESAADVRDYDEIEEDKEGDGPDDEQVHSKQN